MTAIPTVPVTVKPEAAARVAELGMHAEFDQMLQHVLQEVPQLRSIDVELEHPYDTGRELGVSIRAWSALPWQQINNVSGPLDRWRRETFSHHICEHLFIDVLVGGNHAGQVVQSPLARTRSMSMTAIPTVPVTVKPEAAARLAELGMQAELDQMLQRVLQEVPQLRHIDVELEERYDTGGEPGVGIHARTRLPWQEVNKVWWALARWEGETFPPQVLEHLSIEVLCGGNDAGQSISGTGSGSGPEQL